MSSGPWKNYRSKFKNMATKPVTIEAVKKYAALCDVHWRYFNEVLTGKRRASPDLACKIEYLTGIPKAELLPEIFGENLALKDLLARIAQFEQDGSKC